MEGGSPRLPNGRYRFLHNLFVFEFWDIVLIAQNRNDVKVEDMNVEKEETKAQKHHNDVQKIYLSLLHVLVDMVKECAHLMG